MTYYLSTRLSWRFALTRFCILNWVTKLLMRAMLNVHAGRRFPTPAQNRPQSICFWSPPRIDLRPFVLFVVDQMAYPIPMP